MLDNVVFLSPDLSVEKGHTIKLNSIEEKEMAVGRLRNNDCRFGYEMSNGNDSLNSYENDDYVFVADLLEDVRNIHKLIFYDPMKKEWVRGNREIPYIHLNFYEEAIIKKDESGRFIPDDSKLNMGVQKPNSNGTYTLRFNYYWIRQYMVFLQKMFDDNEELLLSLPDDAPDCAPRYGTQEDIFKLISQMEKMRLKDQANQLRIYLKSAYNPMNILIPDLCFIEEAGKQKSIVWGFPKEDKRSISIPMKKTLYNTSAFAELFDDRNALVSNIFVSSLEMILAHETAHVARGHWNLRINEPEYSFERNVMMNCEIQADSTAVKWLINELLYDTIDGNPHSRVLAYTKKRLIYLWSIRIFSAYLSLSWGYREEERIWTVQTIEDFRANKGLTHPIYQFRLFCLLNHAQYHLHHMAHAVDKEHPLWTADHYKVDEQIYKEVWRKTLDMVYSFEASFYIDWKEDERTTEQKIEDALHIKKYCHPDTAEEVPFMIGYMEEARAELEEYESQWPEIFDKLKKYGMYFVL